MKDGVLTQWLYVYGHEVLMMRYMIMRLLLVNQRYLELALLTQSNRHICQMEFLIPVEMVTKVGLL